MDFRQLRYFLAVAQHGSMAEAGRAIHISQPALGEKIRQLEEELGVPLLERHSRGVRLSEAGQRLVTHAEHILGAVEKARLDLTRHAPSKTTRLTIGLNPTASRQFVAGLLEAFDSDTQVLLREAMSHEIQDDVAAGRLDAGFSYDPSPGPYRILEVRNEALYLVGPPRRITSCADIPFDELHDVSLALDSGSNVLRTRLEATARKRAVPLRIAFEVEAVPLKRRLLLRHDQCTVVPYALFAEEIAAKKLNARRIVAPQLRSRLCLLVRRGLPVRLSRLIEAQVKSMSTSVEPRAKA